MQLHVVLPRVGKKCSSQRRGHSLLLAVLQQLRLARQFGTGHVYGPLPITLAVRPACHPYPALRQAFNGTGGVARRRLPAIEQTHRLRAAQAFADGRCLTPSGFHQKICLQRLAPFEADAVAGG